MIHLFQENRRVGEFKHFEELLDYFNCLEDSRVIDYNIYHPSERWNFLYHPYKSPSNTSQLDTEQTWQEEFDTITIFDGDPNDPIQISVTPELDLPELMRDWCFDYGYSHGYRILELHEG